MTIDILRKTIKGVNQTGKTEVGLRDITDTLVGKISIESSTHTATVTFEKGKTFTYDYSGTNKVMVNLTDFVDYFKGKDIFKFDYQSHNDGTATVNSTMKLVTKFTTLSNSNCSICTPLPIWTNVAMRMNLVIM